jgi:hypothetical protein
MLAENATKLFARYIPKQSSQGNEANVHRLSNYGQYLSLQQLVEVLIE